MSEQAKRHNEGYRPSHESARENHEYKAEQPRATHESQQSKVEKAEAAREVIERSAQETHKNKVEKQNEQRPTVHHYLTKHIKNDKFVQTMSQVRTQLTPREQKFSKFIHQPKIEAVSELGAKTVARPSGILGGALISLIGSLLVVIVAKRIGFEVPQSIFAILFAVGFCIGLLFEALTRLLRRKQKPTY